MIYKGPGFPAVVWFVPTPYPSPDSKFYLFLIFLCVASELTDGSGGLKGVGKEPNNTIERKPGPL